MKRFLKSFYYAFNGLLYTFHTQLNFRVECLIALIITGLSFYLNISAMEWLWIIAAIGLVLMTELGNTGIETLVDLVSPEYKTKAGTIKDISAAVVLIAAVLALLTGIIILLPKLIDAT